MYKLLKDKNNEFQCEIKLVGANEKTAKVRLFLEGTGCEYSFNGTIDGTRCRVNLGKLKNFTNLMESGKIRLEVVADDTLFVPYESTYELEESKSVTVEMIQPEQTTKKAMVEVRVEESKPVQKPIVKNQKPIIKKEVKKLNPINEIKKYLEDNTLFNGTMDSFKIAMRSESHKKAFNRLCEVSKLEKSVVIKEILK
jgi:hypothetical protein